MDEREMECKNERIFKNTYITVNVKSKKILSMIKVTSDEHVHDSKALPELVENIIKSDSMVTIGKLFADGAYEGNEVLDVLQTMESCPLLK
jgi:hypothetical protein